MHLTINLQPLEFCSDVFLLPLGPPPKDILHLSESEEDLTSPPPAPPPLDPALYQQLISSLQSNKGRPPTTTSLTLSDDVEHFV